LKYIQTFTRNLSNIPGWRANGKIVIIESDDWGSIRMPSKEAYESLKKAGIDIETGENLRFNKNDTLASADDLASFYQVIDSVRDRTQRPAVITPVSIVANPDFEKIRNSGFNEYFYEPFTETLKRYHGNENTFKLWKEGIGKRLFVPQFHGREHLNVQVWLRALRDNDRDTTIAFNHGVWGYNNINPQKIFYNAAFELDNPDELDFHRSVISDGLRLFNDLFGYKAEFFVPPNGPVNNRLLKTAFDCGIKYVSASKIQRESLGNGGTKRHFHWSGQRNGYGQICITRNCFFEPGMDNRDWVDSCLGEINAAFRWRKPAVISSHRVNYIGAHYPDNRDRGLRELKRLLKAIVQKWPEVEFMTSAELGELMSSE